MQTTSISFQNFSWNKIITLALIIFMLLAVTPVNRAFADELGYFSPTRAVSHGPGWSNPGYALFSDNLYTTATKNNKQLKLTNFYPPAIQGGAIINGIEVTVEGFTTGMQADVALGSSGYSAARSTTFGSSESILTLGGPTDTWGQSWAATDFQNKFTVRLTAKGTGSTLSIDHVQVKIYFTPPDTTIILSPVSGNYGGVTNMTATLTVTATHDPLPGRTISFSLNNVFIADAVTDVNGVASLSGVSLAGITAGDYPYGASASFAGDGSYQATSITADLRVHGLATTLTVNPVSAPYGGSASVTATLAQTLAGTPISGKIIDFALDDIAVGSATTDSFGVASLSNIDLSGYDPGLYADAFEANFAGVTNLEPSTGSSTLTVTSSLNLTVTAYNTLIAAGSPDPIFTFSYAGFAAGDTSADIDTPPTCNVLVPHALAGTYVITCSGGVDNKYGFTYVNGTLTVDDGPDTVGVFRPSNGLLYLKNQNTSGFADVAINYGLGGDYPVVGDWDGNGTDTIGVYRNGSFLLRNSNTLGFADLNFPFGQVGDQPIAGDWNGDGIDTIGIYRPSTGQFLMRNSNTAGSADMSFYLGNVGDVGIAGDWNGDGFDTTGVFRPSNGIIFLKNTNATGFADIALNYGLAGDRPVVGDWDNDGITTIGIYRNARFYLRNSNTNGFANITLDLGNPGDMPIAGNWNGTP